MNIVHQSRRVHFVGIKGIAMAALAVWAKESGKTVTGSDVEEIFPSDEVLKKVGVEVQHGFSPDHVAKDCDLVIYTGAHGGRDNIEVTSARARNIPTLPHGKALGLAMEGHEQISVAGSHGKTTTAAMIATILSSHGASWAIGSGEITGLGLPGHSGRGAYFVAEADEYVTDPGHDKTPRFLWQTPKVLVVTNIDYDHPDVYSSLADVQEAFVALQNHQTEASYTLVNIDDVASRPLLKKTKSPRVVTYGVSEKAEYRMTEIASRDGMTTWCISHLGQLLMKCTLSVPGHHNAIDASAAAIACHLLGIPVADIQEGLARFGGAKRRFEKLGQSGGVVFYDDYAHHPHEIAATLEGVRAWYPKHRIIVIFQPHTYSRTKALLLDFGKAFGDADIVVSTDIYASAREHDTLEITGQTLVSEIKKNHAHVVFAPTSGDVLRELAKMLRPDDIVIFMGAGDIYAWEKELVKKLIAQYG